MITIKDVCTILGIAPSTIRLYEKCLPAVPWSVEDNGYRGFYFENILHLADCRTMVKYGMSLQESFDVSLAKSLEAKEGALDRQRDRLVEEVRHLNDLLLVIDEQRALMAKISTLIEGYEVVDMPAFFHFPFAGNRIYPGLHELVSNWAAAIPFVEFTPHYGIAEYLAGRCSLDRTGHAGFAVSLRFSHLVDTSAPSVQLVPAQRCVGAVVVTEGIARPDGVESFAGGLPRDEGMFARTTRRLKEALAREGYGLRGNIYTRLVHAEYPAVLPGEEPEREGVCYFYVWTPLLEEGPSL